MGWIIWGGVLLSCLVAAWLILRGPLRQLSEDVHAERARELFRQRREWLEADFLGALGKIGPAGPPGSGRSFRADGCRPAYTKDRLLRPPDFAACAGQLRRDLQRDDADAVLVGVAQVAGADPAARAADALAEIDQAHVGTDDARV